MLCHFCSNIDLDQLASEEGYKHHASCADLLQSAENGCESCNLIWNSHWVEVGGDLSEGRRDFGPLEMEIIARAVNQKPGGYHKIRYAQEKRQDEDELQSLIKSSPFGADNTSPGCPFLWSFLSISSMPGDLSTKYIKYRPLSQRSPTSWLPLATGWLKECLATHEACTYLSSTTTPPTRVLDIGTSEDSPDPHLHISGVEVQEWVTLSHCWGQHQPLQTTVANLSQHLQSLPIHRLPLLFQDAIEITKALGYRYLWIDSLCIIQDSKEDWLRELTIMGQIYKSSVFTIGADNCCNHTERMLGNYTPIRTEYTQQGCHSSQEGFKSVIYAFDSSKWQEHQEARGYLRHRAWALQEQILPPRTLQWTSLEVQWHCRHTNCSEESPVKGKEAGFHSAVHGPGPKLICLSAEQLQAVGKASQNQLGPEETDPTQIWYSIVQQHCMRNLSFVQDTLPPYGHRDQVIP